MSEVDVLTCKMPFLEYQRTGMIADNAYSSDKSTLKRNCRPTAAGTVPFVDPESPEALSSI